MDPVAPPAPSRPTRTRWAWWLATFYGIGYLKPGPGTWASCATVLLWGLLSLALPATTHRLAVIFLAIVAATVGIMAGHIVTRESGSKDPQIVVIDEVAGQLLALVAAPFGWKSLLLGLILFRCFDVLKPPPCRRLELLPGGYGVMLDDIVAGAYAAAVIFLLFALPLYR